MIRKIKLSYEVAFLAVETAWLSIRSAYEKLNSPIRYVCAHCKKALGGNPRSESISHGICAGCYFRTIRPTLMVMLALLSLGLSACEKKSRMTPAVDEQAYCREHPSECVMKAQEEVRP